jgi:hypothetical protein
MTETRPDLVIYGSPISPFVRKVAGVCIAKGVPYDVEAINVFDPPAWFRDISPMKRIPVLRDRSVAEEGIAGFLHGRDFGGAGALEAAHFERVVFCVWIKVVALTPMLVRAVSSRLSIRWN